MFDFANPGYEIIDAHVHPFSCYGCLDTTKLGGATVDDDFVLALKGAGISRAAGSVIARVPAEQFTWETVHGFNLKALEGRDRYDGFLIPGICVHPWFVKESLEEIDYMYHKENVRFIGELVAYMMHYRNYAAPEMGMVVNLHLNHLDEVRHILKNFPDLKLIIAHPTADSAEYEARMRLVAKYPNAALDFSGSGPNTWGMLRRGINWAGKEKLLFGTDFPIRNPGMYVAGVLY